MDKLTEIKEDAMKRLYEHLGFDGVDGTYIYILTRVKEAFHVGTMTLDDFVEVDDDFVGELADLFAEMAKPLLQLVEIQAKALEFYADESNNDWDIDCFDRVNQSKVMEDGGQRAREAIKLTQV